MASGIIAPGTDYMTVFDRVYPIKNDTITVPSSGIGGTATVIATCSSSGWLYNTALNTTCKSTLYICDVDGNNAIAIFSKQLAAQATDRTSVFKKTIDISNLMGKRVYAYMHPNTSSGSAGVIINTSVSTGGLSIEIWYNAVAGQKIRATDRSQTGTSTSAGTVISDSHFSKGTKAEASTFNSQVLGI